jgi:hypothetical protein
VRENRTPGSVQGAPGNRCPYCDALKQGSFMRSLDDWYRHFRVELQNEAPHLLAEFEGLAARGDPKAVFLWLNELSRKGDLPRKIEPMLTDFFYSIR